VLAVLGLDLISETSDTLVDLTMSEVHFDEVNISTLCAVTKESPRSNTGEDLEVSRTREVTALHDEEQLIAETEGCGVDHTEDINCKTDQSTKLEELRQTCRKKRRKSASDNGCVSQYVSRPLAIQLPSDKLQKVRDAVERAIRVSITKILYI
jgi:hypothetical protein